MKVAVVTPFYTESVEILLRCVNSVASQTVDNIEHILVADGVEKPRLPRYLDREVIVLPKCHADAGATPRAIGAISCFSRGFDAVAFLDADNTYQSNHLECMIGLMEQYKSSVVTATRNICDLDGTVMYVDRVESDGDKFCDTNCLFIGKPTINLLTYWITQPGLQLWSDRQFWSAICQTNIAKIHCSLPTVNYHSKWAWHYSFAGIEPPANSVWIDVSEGRLVHTHHSTKRTKNES